jgi:hypothetical protein
VDGGPGYYGQFADPLPTSADYFPIGVWASYAHEPEALAKDKAVGLNLYVSVAQPLYMGDIRAAGMRVIQVEETRENVGTETAGWVLRDEIDMVQSDAAGAAAARDELRRMLASLPADGKARYNNYGKGVAFWNTDLDSEQYVNDFQQLVSADVYWHTDPGGACSQWEGGKMNGNTRPLTPAECRRSSNYGWLVERLRALDAMDGQRKPIWNFVEVGCPFSNGGCITPAQARAAVWHSIIAGARGILYFQHSFGGPNPTHHALRDDRYAAMIAQITGVNAQIKSLAPVLNAPTVVSGWTQSAATKAMVKWAGGHFYVFAGSAENAASTGSFTIPCVGQATAVVLGENRSIPVTGGGFSDNFADGNAVHVYRIDGGSSCGLT